jgi:DNA-binding beta-propeller fold protein YncE
VIVTPDGNSAYVTDFGIPGRVFQYDVAANGALSAKTPASVTTANIAMRIALTPNGRNAYVTNDFAGVVSRFDIGGDGKLVPESPATINTGPNPQGIAISPNGTSTYVGAADDNVYQYGIDADGKLLPKSPQTVAAAGDVSSVAVTGEWPSRPPSPPAPPNGNPSNAFSFGKVKKNKRKGTAKLTVIVLGPGELVLAGKKVKGDTEQVEATAAGASPNAIKAVLKVKAKGKGKRKLKRTGKAKVKADVTYTPDGGEPNTKSKRVKLKRR